MNLQNYMEAWKETNSYKTLSIILYIYICVYVCIYIYIKPKVVMSVNSVREIKPQIQTTWYTKEKSTKKTRQKRSIFSI